MSDAVFHITQLEPQKKNPNRVNVYLDDAFAFGLNKEVVLRHHLHEGDKIKESLIDDVLLTEEIARAKEKALALLSYRSRSQEELHGKLRIKGYGDKIIQRVISDFTRVGLLDDAAFASAYVQTRMIQKPMSKRLLLQELKLKGIAESLSIHAVKDGYAETSEEEVASQLVRDKLNKILDKTSIKTKKKLSDFLARRGFGWDVIQGVVGDCFE